MAKAKDLQLKIWLYLADGQRCFYIKNEKKEHAVFVDVQPGWIGLMVKDYFSGMRELTGSEYDPTTEPAENVPGLSEYIDDNRMITIDYGYEVSKGNTTYYITDGDMNFQTYQNVEASWFEPYINMVFETFEKKLGEEP